MGGRSDGRGIFVAGGGQEDLTEGEEGRAHRPGGTRSQGEGSLVDCKALLLEANAGELGRKCWFLEARPWVM